MNSKTHLAARAPRHARKKATAALVSFALAFAFPHVALASVGYMPDVEADMSKAAYWSDKEAAPDAVLVDAEEIAAVNEAIADGKGTNVQDLSQ